MHPIERAARDRLRPDRLVEEALTQAGGLSADALGEPTWQEGLDVLVDSLVADARLNDLGVEVAATDLVGHLARRAAIGDWRRRHPDEGHGRVDAPLVIMGQPRTGTTILYDLLAQDPGLRPPLTWEVDRPVPPPETATFDDDPRIAEVQAVLDLADAVIPGFTAFHPMGARLAQECVRITGADFRSMIFPTQYRVLGYNRWLLHEADLAPAYRWHRTVLQHLQSRHPAPRWLLKSPCHLWHLPALMAEYPDAVVVQTHRDPLQVIASVSALVAHLRRMASDDPTVADAAEQYADDILVGLERGMADRDAGVLPAAQVVDLRFAEFVADPLAAIGALYDRLGRTLTADTEAAMRAFLAAHPGDGGGSGHRYTWSATGLDAAPLRERAAAYQQRYGVDSETLR